MFGDRYGRVVPLEGHNYKQRSSLKCCEGDSSVRCGYGACVQISKILERLWSRFEASLYKYCPNALSLLLNN